ncbi:MAG: hypothetical protein HC794_03945 [Nitrospiraceae bacterium]|nr:hypothetical protein [Nitrospiraceae bacterium]
MTILHGLLAVVILFLVVNGGMLPDCVRADVQYFRFPLCPAARMTGMMPA